MSLLIKKAGILDTFQDMGRFGFAEVGVNPNGAMDRIALRIANILLNNPENLAALEFHNPAPILEFLEPVSFVLTGACFGAALDGSAVSIRKPYQAKANSILEFKNRGAFGRCYLQVRNGFCLDTWKNSDSTNLIASAGGFSGRNLRNGDVVGFKNAELIAHGHRAGPMFSESDDRPFILRFVPGPAFEDLTAKSALDMELGIFGIHPNSNRMAFKLTGDPLFSLLDQERISSAVTFGTIQLLPDGQLVVLMADHQTTGGYPNLGTIIGPDLSVAAQKSNGMALRFQTISAPEAEKITNELEKQFSFLRIGIRLCSGTL